MKSKIKVLQIIGSLRIGGAENMAMNIIRYIDKDCYKVDYLVFTEEKETYEEEAEKYGATIYHIPPPKDGFLKYYKNLKTIIKNNNYDIIHSHMLLNNGVTLFISKLVGNVSTISHSHSTKSGRKTNSIIDKLYYILMKIFIFLFSDIKIACGNDAGRYLYGKKSTFNQWSVINNGVDTAAFRKDLKKANAMKKKLNIDDEIVIGHIGRMSSEKNHTFLLDIYNEFHKKNDKDVLLLLGDGELKNELVNIANKLELSDNIKFLGNVNNVNEIMQAIDIIIFPSFYEGVPLALIESQLMNIPCVVSDNVSKDVVISDLITFESIKKNTDEWVEKIEEVLQTSYKGPTKLEIKQYDIKNSVNIIETIYSNISERRG